MRQTIAARFDVSFFGRPHLKKSFGPVVNFRGAHPFRLRLMKGPFGDLPPIRHWANLFDIHADFRYFGNSDNGQLAGMRQVEA